MGKFLALILVAVSAYFVAVTEGKQYMDMSCHPGYIGEARALEIEKDCRETDSSGTDCYKMCVLKEFGFITSPQGDENPKYVALESYHSLMDNIRKLFSPEAQDVAKKLGRSMDMCGDQINKISDDMPCGSASDYHGVYACLEGALSC